MNIIYEKNGNELIFEAPFILRKTIKSELPQAQWDIIRKNWVLDARYEDDLLSLNDMFNEFSYKKQGRKLYVKVPFILCGEFKKLFPRKVDWDHKTKSWILSRYYEDSLIEYMMEHEDDKYVQYVYEKDADKSYSPNMYINVEYPAQNTPPRPPAQNTPPRPPAQNTPPRPPAQNTPPRPPALIAERKNQLLREQPSNSYQKKYLLFFLIISFIVYKSIINP